MRRGRRASKRLLRNKHSPTPSEESDELEVDAPALEPETDESQADAPNLEEQELDAPELEAETNEPKDVQVDRESEPSAPELELISDQPQCDLSESDATAHKESDRDAEPKRRSESNPNPYLVAEPSEPPKRRPGRPRKSEQKPKPVEDKVPSEQKRTIDNIVLNARGTPMRQIKRNRFYEDDESDLQQKIKSDKKAKTEPLQILLDNPGNSIQVTPIMSKGMESDSDASITLASPTPPPPVLARKSVVTLVTPTPIANATTTNNKVLEEKQNDTKIVVTPIIPPKTTYEQKLVVSVTNPKKPEYNRVDSYRKSDYYNYSTSFIRFFASVKTKVILPDRWSINGVMFDPSRMLKTFIMSEMQIDENGQPSVRKSIQVFEDLSLMISFFGKDLTAMIGIRKVQSEHDVASLVGKVNAMKICSGVKAFEIRDLTYHPLARKKGTCYFSHECSTVLTFNSMGALCASCSKMRNAIRRRKVKAKQDQEKAASKPIVKQIQSSFGRGLYSLLDQLTTENKTKRQSKGGPLSEMKADAPVTGNRSRRTYGSATEQPRKQRRIHQTADNVETASFTQMIDPTTGLPVRQAYLEDGTLVNYVNLGDGHGGNLVIQNGGEFKLADGQEYEIIGETDTDGVEPLQLLNPKEEQTIQIIEVDDHTMAQLATQNVNMEHINSVFFSDPSNIQVTEVDLNDPNTTFKILGM